MKMAIHEGFRMVDLKYLERRNKKFPMLSQGHNASNKDKRTHLSQYGSVIKLHFFFFLVGSFYGPQSLFLLSEIRIYFEVCMLHHSS